MAKIDRVTKIPADSISSQHQQKFFLRKVIFDPPYFENMGREGGGGLPSPIRVKSELIKSFHDYTS